MSIHDVYFTKSYKIQCEGTSPNEPRDIFLWNDHMPYIFLSAAIQRTATPFPFFRETPESLLDPGPVL